MYVENKGLLDAVALGDEDAIIISSQCEVETCDVLLYKVVFRTVLVNNNALKDQRLADPLRR